MFEGAVVYYFYLSGMITCDKTSYLAGVAKPLLASCMRLFESLTAVYLTFFVYGDVVWGCATELTPVEVFGQL